MIHPYSTVRAEEKEAGQAAQLLSEPVKATIQYENDPRTIALRMLLLDYHSPMTYAAETFVRIADEFNLDWRLVPSIAGAESSFGNKIPRNSYNAWGWGVYTGKQSGVSFSSWEDGIYQVSRGLKYNYVDHGRISTDAIGKIYAASPDWSNHVSFFINRINQFFELTPQLAY